LRTRKEKAFLREHLYRRLERRAGCRPHHKRSHGTFGGAAPGVERAH
jgi:hypothetical protein